MLGVLLYSKILRDCLPTAIVSRLHMVELLSLSNNRYMRETGAYILYLLPLAPSPLLENHPVTDGRDNGRGGHG